METIGSDRGLAKGVTLALACTVLVFLMAPMLVVFPVSVTDQRFLAFPQEAVSFAHYGKVMTGGGWLNAIWQSLAIALAATAIDVVVGEDGDMVLSAPRLDVPNTHGTGCTFAAAIAARLALGQPLDEAIRGAKEYVTGAMRHGIAVGTGHRPLGHFWQTP